ncbi:MAG: cation transporter [Bacilli bacterium]|nr:cation transporter [Bacilli bacterium]
MKNILIRLFIKDYKNTKSPIVRAAYGTLAGIVGIVSNIILAGIKMIVGTVALSPAIFADGVNNFSDGLSSIITIIGFKLSTKKADADHPFGHQRIEYITGLIISFLILTIGFSLFKESIIGVYDLIRGQSKPLDVSNKVVVIGCLLLSIAAKCWQAIFYKGMGKAVESDTLEANAKDSLNDCITTTAVLISTIIYIISDGKINIDSVAGLVVSIFILISSVGLIKETINPLLGEIPSDEFIDMIAKKILAYDGVLGIHDLVIHSYGPNMNYITVHVEVSREVDVMESHDLIDNIEREFREQLELDLTIHMDPVEVNDEITNEVKEVVKQILLDIDEQLTFHDFRVVPGITHTNVLFDVVMPIEYAMTPKELKEIVSSKIKEHNESWFAVIQVDQLYNRITHK